MSVVPFLLAPSERKFRTVGTCRFCSRGRDYEMPDGWETNGPKLFADDARVWQGAVPHDWLCSDTSVKITRLEADLVSYDLHIRHGVPKWKALVLLAGKRAFGWITWNKR